MLETSSQGTIKLFGWKSAAYRRHIARQTQSSASDKTDNTQEGNRDTPEGIHTR